jgi:hypothetical protein
MSNAIDLREIDPEKLYTLNQMAEFIRSSYGTVLKIKKNSELPHTKLGKRVYVKGMDIIKYVQDGRVAP